MDVSEALSVVGTLAVVWVLCAAAAAGLLWAADKTYRGWVRFHGLWRKRPGPPQEWRAHPVRKHGRRIAVGAAPSRSDIRRRVYPLV
jgi:hypothetical protein